MAGRFCRLDKNGKPLPYAGYATHDEATGESRWTRKVGLVENQVNDPLSIRRPTTIFVNSMSDTFHEAVPVDWIARCWAVMDLSRRHTYMVLTKRATRMREVLNDPAFLKMVDDWRQRIRPGCGDFIYPLPNVRLGVSVENNKHGAPRVLDLLLTRAAFRWLSIEPLLEAVDVRPWVRQAIDYVIVGGESGQGARPFAVEWARQIVKDCREADVPVFVKQLGSQPTEGGQLVKLKLSKKGGDMEEWPEDVRVRDVP